MAAVGWLLSATKSKAVRAAFKLPSQLFTTMNGLPTLRRLRWKFRDRQVLFACVIIVLFLTIFVLYPLFSILKSAVYHDGVTDFTYFLELLSGRPYLLRPLTNSLVLASVVGLLCTGVGLLLALATLRSHVPGIKILRYILMLPLISPPFLMALAVILLLGRNGLITKWLASAFGIRFDIYGLPGLIITQFFTFLPLAFVSLEAILEMVTRSQIEEASVDLGASRWYTFRRATLPLLRPGVLSVFLLTFIRSLEDFANPIILQGRFPVLTTQVYLAITGMYNVPLGATLATILLILSFAVFASYKLAIRGKSFVVVSGRLTSVTRRELIYLSPVGRYTLFILTALVATSILIFYGVIFVGAFTRLWGIDYNITLANFDYVFSVGKGYLINSLKLAGISTAIGAIYGTVIAYFTARRKIPGASIIDFISLLNFAVPGIVLGLGFVLAFNTPPFKLTGTAFIIIMVFVTQRMPVILREVDSMLRQVDPSLDESSTDLGGSQMRTLLQVVTPVILPGIIGGMAYMFAACITSISAVIMVVSPKWYLITLSMLSQIDLGALSVACAYGVVIIGVVFTVIVLLDVLVKRAVHRMLVK